MAGAGGRRRKAKPDVREAAERAFLVASILISSIMPLFRWLASKP